MKKLIAILPLLLASLAAGAAPQPGSILVKTVAEQEQTVTAADGSTSTVLTPAKSVLPGHEVVYTVTFQNIGQDAARDVVVTNPVPEHTRYQAGSAFGPGTDLLFSADGGRSFAAADALEVRGTDGSVRTAGPEDYTHIRFVLKNSLTPGAVAFARYRTIVK
jgi:uncharacterized repeat protein (TIGR01451 family)